MADVGPAALKMPTACKPPMKAAPPASLAQQEQDAVQHVQQNLVKPTSPAQVPKPVPPPAPPAQVPNPVQPIYVQVNQANPN